MTEGEWVDVERVDGEHLESLIRESECTVRARPSNSVVYMQLNGPAGREGVDVQLEDSIVQNFLFGKKLGRMRSTSRLLTVFGTLPA